MDVVLLAAEEDPEAVIPALPLLPHTVRVLPPLASSLGDLSGVALALVDARSDLAASRALCRLLSGSGDFAVIAVVSEGGLIAVSGDWGLDDILLPATGPAEVDARFRLAAARRSSQSSADGGLLTVGDLVIDEETYVARVKGRALDLTYKEFELLKHLCHHPGRVFSRAQLLQEVWGYDFFGGTRTVDVHIRRLRAKLGPDHESLIGTVRNVGYKAVRPTDRREDGE
ncbi:winged-helix domain-containing protein [Dietzia sp. ANT_WB102]|uniref:winged helix-turn-helix domain-containing protein n=1 Tax=Dietzia sp. ANT_WB102 TaxID=2597345 RepID=UPI0011EBAB2D|nr:winged-helix domain-containing protein [Dietzia sp. ANT_WB102]KAA0916485.1 winged-helix domain-containing protein [Dietzia sp. ANT_WB102]